MMKRTVITSLTAIMMMAVTPAFARVHREPTGLQERRTATAQIEISDDQTRLII